MSVRLSRRWLLADKSTGAHTRRVAVLASISTTPMWRGRFDRRRRANDRRYLSARIGFRTAASRCTVVASRPRRHTCPLRRCVLANRAPEHLRPACARLHAKNGCRVRRSAPSGSSSFRDRARRPLVRTPHRDSDDECALRSAARARVVADLTALIAQLAREFESGSMETVSGGSRFPPRATSDAAIRLDGASAQR